MARGGRWTSGPLGWVVVLVLAGCGGSEPPDNRGGGKQRETEPLELTGGTRWVRTVRSEGASDAPVAVAHDGEGNVLTVGNHRGPIDFGQEPLSGPPRGTPVLVISKHAADGTRLWVRHFEAPPRAGTSPFVRASALAVEKYGTLLLTGVQSGGLELGAGALPPGAFLARLSPEGHPLWARALPTSATELAVDARGHITLAGQLTGPVDFGGGVIHGTGNPYLVRYGPEGELRWVHVEPVSGLPMDLAQDDAGDLYLVGGQFLSPSRLLSPFLTRVSSEGKRLWTRPLEGATGLAMSVAAHGDHVVVSGYFSGQFTFRGKSFSAPTTRGFALTHGRDGTERWGLLLGSTSGLVAMDQGSGVVLAGRYTRGEDFGLGTDFLEGYPGATNLYVLRLHRPTGKLQWMRTFPSTASLPVDLSATRKGASALVGTFRGVVELDTGSLNPGPGSNTFLLQLER